MKEPCEKQGECTAIKILTANAMGEKLAREAVQEECEQLKAILMKKEHLHEIRERAEITAPLLSIIRKQEAEIERLKPLAELALEAMINDESFGCSGSHYKDCEKLSSKCPWLKICAKCAEMRGADSER